MPSARAKRPGAAASGERRAAAIPPVRTQGAGDAIAVRHYGTSGPFVALLHGGPGAAGYLAPLARELDDCFRVLEPLQRSAGRAPLGVASHLADLHQVLERDCAGALPLLVGHSWGAMLALAYAAARPRNVRGLVLIGCGTFDPVSRARLQATVEQRVDAALRQRLERLPLDLPDPDARLRQLGSLLLPVYSYEAAVTELAATSCDARAHDESWRDMLRLQEAGV
jgi:pimeloyl-ACP methyl ester carboxylesterase